VILSIAKAYNPGKPSAYKSDNSETSLLKDKRLKQVIRYLFKSLIPKQFGGLVNPLRDRFYGSAKEGYPALLFLPV
jgi:hypothetical protein